MKLKSEVVKLGQLNDKTWFGIPSTHIKNRTKNLFVAGFRFPKHIPAHKVFKQFSKDNWKKCS